MRTCLLLTAAAVLAVHPARAQPSPAEAVSAIDDICVKAAMPVDTLSAGERAAHDHGWVAKEKAPALPILLLGPLPILKGSPSPFRSRLWAFSDNGSEMGALSISLSDPERSSGARLDVCQIAVPGNVLADAEDAVRKEFDRGPGDILGDGIRTWSLPAGNLIPPAQGFKTLFVGPAVLSVADAPIGPCQGSCKPAPTHLMTMIGVVDGTWPSPEHWLHKRSPP